MRIDYVGGRRWRDRPESRREFPREKLAKRFGVDDVATAMIPAAALKAHHRPRALEPPAHATLCRARVDVEHLSYPFGGELGARRVEFPHVMGMVCHGVARVSSFVARVFYAVIAGTL